MGDCSYMTLIGSNCATLVQIIRIRWRGSGLTTLRPNQIFYDNTSFALWLLPPWATALFYVRQALCVAMSDSPKNDPANFFSCSLLCRLAIIFNAWTAWT